jgi:uncharacterized membrane protein
VKIARQGIALLALLGLFVAAYLYLYKVGAIGSLACGSGGCETVQLSKQSRFLGVEVALIGVLGYAVLLILALLGLQESQAGRSGSARALLVLSGIAVVFTLYLKGLELFVIHAICRWCVVSAVIIVAIFVLALWDWRRSGRVAA